MPDRAAIVTGASRGIGFAIADALAGEGYSLTVTARKPEGVEQAAEKLRARGVEVEPVAANLSDAEAVAPVVATHRERFGRLDVLVNNAGVGIGAAVADQQPKYVDMQLGVNLRAIILFYKECAEMLRAAGAPHPNGLGVNLAAGAGQSGPGWLAVSSAAQAGVIGHPPAMDMGANTDGG